MLNKNSIHRAFRSLPLGSPLFNVATINTGRQHHMSAIVALWGLPISQLIAIAIVDRAHHSKGKAFLFLNMSAWLAFFYLYAFLISWNISSQIYSNLSFMSFSAIYILSMTTLIYLFLFYAQHYYFFLFIKYTFSLTIFTTLNISYIVFRSETGPGRDMLIERQSSEEIISTLYFLSPVSFLLILLAMKLLICKKKNPTVVEDNGLKTAGADMEQSRPELELNSPQLIADGDAK